LGQVWRAPPREAISGDPALPLRAPFILGRPIWRQWSRLDRRQIRSGPSDRDPTAHIRRYRFGLVFLLKSPRSFAESTRRPELCKSIYRSVLYLAVDPLTFLELVPAVQHLFFYELDLEALVYLRLDPRFLQKSPWNTVFITNKPLNLVLGLVYAF